MLILAKKLKLDAVKTCFQIVLAIFELFIIMSIWNYRVFFFFSSLVVIGLPRRFIVIRCVYSWSGSSALRFFPSALPFFIIGHNKPIRVVLCGRFVRSLVIQLYYIRFHKSLISFPRWYYVQNYFHSGYSVRLGYCWFSVSDGLP